MLLCLRGVEFARAFLEMCEVQSGEGEKGVQQERIFESEAGNVDPHEGLQFRKSRDRVTCQSLVVVEELDVSETENWLESRIKDG